MSVIPVFRRMRKDRNLVVSLPLMNSYFVYILGSKSGVLYIGVTNNLVKRVFEHKEKYAKGFSKKYNVSRLLYLEETSDVTFAIHREKQLKRWNREWKENLININNPG